MTSEDIERLLTEKLNSYATKIELPENTAIK